MKYEASKEEEDGVTADRVRILAHASGRPLKSGEIVKGLKAIKEDGDGDVSKEVTTRIVESTGLGGWGTVSDWTVVEDESEIAANEGDEDKEVDEEQDSQGKRSRGAGPADEDDTLALVDPYGTNVYKGLSLNGTDYKAKEVISLAKGAPVQFKNRVKSEAGMTGNIRCIRVKTSNEGH